MHRTVSPSGDWEIVLGEPSSDVRPCVQGWYVGSVERITGTLTRLQVPHPGVVCIFSFGDPYRVADPRDQSCAPWLDSFVAGLYDGFVHVDARGRSQCVQCNLTPLGAVRLLGMPLEAIANRAVAMGDVLEGADTTFVAQLHEAGSWEGRFALLDQLWRRRLQVAPDVPPLVTHAWHALESSGGNASVEALARALSCSRKRLAAHFRAHVGLTPRRVGRILRFGHVVERLHASGGRRLSGIAHACGYYDHAHLDRDFQDFAGCSPTHYLSRRDPDFGVILGNA